MKKIVSIPAKWVSKKVVHHYLLQFDKKERSKQVQCMYCPELCRFSCPTSIVTSNDATTPSNKMSLIYQDYKWPETLKSERWPIYQCTGCGRCTDYCLYGVDVATELFKVRKEYPLKQVQTILENSKSGNSRLGDDKVGDLHAELGLEFHDSNHVTSFVVDEPKEYSFLLGNAKEVSLQWMDMPFAIPKTKNVYWYLSPHLKKSVEALEKLKNWSDILSTRGFKMHWPRVEMKDLFDHGGEGMYHEVFEKDAKSLVTEWWKHHYGIEKPTGTAEILSTSQRAIDWFKKSSNTQFEYSFIGDSK